MSKSKCPLERSNAKSYCPYFSATFSLCTSVTNKHAHMFWQWQTLFEWEVFHSLLLTPSSSHRCALFAWLDSECRSVCLCTMLDQCLLTAHSGPKPSVSNNHEIVLYRCLNILKFYFCQISRIRLCSSLSSVNSTFDTLPECCWLSIFHVIH